MHGLKILTSLLFCVFIIGASAANVAEETVGVESVKRAIAHYMRDPLSEDGMAAGSFVLRFAQESPNIQIALSKKIIPWITADKKLPHADELFMAYLVGNVQSQVLRQKALDNPYAGMLMVFEVYELIKQKEGGVSIKSIDQLQQIHSQGRLRRHMFSLLDSKPPEASGKDLISRVGYPRELGEYTFAGVEDYEKPEYGISIRYLKNRSDYFDVYVYPVSNQELEKAPKDVVMQEYGGARSGIYYGQERGIYQQLNPENESFYKVASNIYPVTRGLFTLTRDHKSLFTVLYVTISNEYYVKLRATYPNNKHKAASDHLEKIFNQIIDNVRIQ